MPESFRSSTVRSDWGRFDKQADRILSVRRHTPVFGDWGDCLEKSRSKETGGTGLGLAIVKHAVMYHKGSVRVESEEGKGTVFVLRIPTA